MKWVSIFDRNLEETTIYRVDQIKRLIHVKEEQLIEIITDETTFHGFTNEHFCINEYQNFLRDEKTKVFRIALNEIDYDKLV